MTHPRQSGLDLHMRATCRMLARPFTARNLAKEIGLHLNTAYRLIKEGRDQGWITCIGSEEKLDRSGPGTPGFLYKFQNPFEGRAEPFVD